MQKLHGYYAIILFLLLVPVILATVKLRYETISSTMTLASNETKSLFHFTYQDTDVFVQYQAKKTIELMIHTGLLFGDLFYERNLTADSIRLRIPMDDTIYFTFTNPNENEMVITYTIQFKSTSIRMNLSDYFLGIMAFGIVIAIFFLIYEKYGYLFVNLVRDHNQEKIAEIRTKTNDGVENRESKTQMIKEQFTKSSVITKDGKKIRKCQNCKGENPLDSQFCQTCGKILSKDFKEGKICPECGKNLPIDAIYCVSCHKSLDVIKARISQQENLCPYCNQSNPFNARYCQRCGKLTKFQNG